MAESRGRTVKHMLDGMSKKMEGLATLTRYMKVAMDLGEAIAEVRGVHLRKRYIELTMSCQINPFVKIGVSIAKVALEVAFSSLVSGNAIDA